MTEFVVIGSEAINPAHVVRALWVIAEDGRDGHIQIHLGNGELRSVPLKSPDAKLAADTFGFGKRFEAWPKQLAEAQAKWDKAAAEKKAEAAKRLRLRAA